MAFKIKGKEMYPIFDFTMCCWSVHSQMVRHAKHTHREKPFLHKFCSFTSYLRACLACSASIECVFSIYDLVCPKIRKRLDVEKAEKLVKIYRLCRAEEDNH